MKPNFALSLSFEGISLLHRAFPGWNRVGEVALDSPDLAGALAVLRDTAEQVAGTDIVSKLVIPNDQIKYLSLDLGMMTEDDRHTAVREALDGATPYPVDDLAFDWSVDGDRTQVAAVARETLAEAEAFAQSHGFAPISFVAIPEQGQFSGEPFFGPTAAAPTLLPDGEQVHRDMAAIRITGVARLPDPGDRQPGETETAPAAPVVAEPEPARIPDPQPAVAPEPKPEPKPESKPEPKPEPVADSGVPDETTEELTQSEPEPEPKPEPEPLVVFGRADDTADDTANVFADDIADDASDAPQELPQSNPQTATLDGGDAIASAADTPNETRDDISDDTADIVPAFSTMRARRDDHTDAAIAPALGGATRHAEGLTAPSIPVPAADLFDDAVTAPTIDSTPASYDASDDLDGIDNIPPIPIHDLRDTDGPLDVPDDDEDVFDDAYVYANQDESDAPDTPDLVKPRETRLAVLGRRSTAMATGLAGGMRSTLANRAARRAEAAESLAESNAQPAVAQPRQDRETERQRMTVFGARKPEKKQPDIGGKPRFLGLILSVALLLFLAAVAAWASIFSDEGLSRFFGGPRDTQIVQLPSDAVDELTIEGEEAMVPTPPESTQAAQTEMASLATPDPQDAPPTLLQPALPHALTEKEAQARYTVTGVWQRAPQEPQLPDVQSLDDLYVASIDPRVDAQDAVALPSLSQLSTDFAMARVPVPAARGARFAFDDRGLVVARAEGTLSPEGFVVYAGRPSSVPPALPQDLANVVPEPDAARDQLAAKRPRSRPSGIVEANERTTLGGLTRVELASKRPKLRPDHPDAATQTPDNATATPDTAQATQSTETTETTETTVQEPTEQVKPGTEFAVATSRKPKPRPSNFATKVERARQAAKTTEPAETTRVAAAVPRQQVVKPVAPSKNSVAKAATVRNQINLRRINLIGVYGKPNSRRALVRLSNGRYKKVKVGDRLDGGRVSSIRDQELRYTKNGRNVILKMPRG